MATMYYMKLLMDSDCLIKITKSGIKELVVAHCTIDIPKIVESEVVQEGKKKECSDAYVVEKNIAQGRLKILQASSDYTSGDEAMVDLFSRTAFDAVATDDAKLARKLRANGIPYILPALILHRLALVKSIDKNEAEEALDRLAGYISPDEFATVTILLETIK